jgi:cyclophilin family peptidyl-prolyl cis-trans isomerase
MSRCCRAVIFLFCVLFVSVSQAGVLAQFRTIFGDIEVELFEKDKPITVANFLRYVESGRYRDMFIHRCDPNFVIQGGGAYVANRGIPGSQSIEFIPGFGTIPNEYGKGTIYSNRYGTIAMAKRAGLTNSATSEWFFNLKDNFLLDAQDTNNYFTVFGRVVRGTNVLNVFRTFQDWNETASEMNVIVDLTLPPYNFPPNFAECPFLTGQLGFNDLLYVDISLLNVQITRLANAREISWNSVAGLTNRVQYTTNFPPVWNQLIQTNGNGLTMRVQDDSAGARFYRVVVDY